MTARAGRNDAFAAVVRQMRATPSVVAYVLIAGLLGLIPGLAVPLLMRVFLDQYLGAAATEWAVAVLVGLALACATTAVLSWVEFRVLTRLAVRLSAATATRYAWHALRIPSPDVAAFGVGGLVARAAGLQRQAFQAGVYIPLSAVKVLTVVAYLLAIVALDRWLGLAAVCVVVVSLVAGVYLLRHRGPLQRTADLARVDESAQTTDIVAAIETVKASAAEPWVFQRWSLMRSRTGVAVSTLSADGQRLSVLSPLTQTVGLGLVLALGSWLVVRGELTLGTLVAAQSLLVAVLVPASQLIYAGVLLAAVGSTQHQADEVRAVALDPEVRPVAAGAAGAAGAAPRPRPRAVSGGLRGVTFGYDPAGEPLLSDLDVWIPAGSWVAVVGASGSGKSTLARLLVGDLQPWAGRVLIDDRPRLAVPRPERAELVGYVPQYPVLMPGTIHDNITMFDDTITPDAVAAAVRDACITTAIDARPRGLREEVGPSGHGFSGGELQRLAIARALVRDPALLILDEATSALDPLVEVELGQRLRARGCSCLLVAHRLSTVRDADEILVVEGGRVVQQGPYDRIRLEGRFAELAHG